MSKTLPLMVGMQRWPADVCKMFGVKFDHTAAQYGAPSGLPLARRVSLFIPSKIWSSGHTIVVEATARYT